MPLKAIRLKCRDCCNGKLSEIRRCNAEGCPLWIFRMGHNSQRQKIGRPENLCRKTALNERKSAQNYELDRLLDANAYIVERFNAWEQAQGR